MEINYISGILNNSSTLVEKLDSQFLYMHIILVGLMLTVLIPMFYFIFKYSAKRHPKEKAQNFIHNTKLEILWTVIPTAVLMLVFFYGYDSLKELRTIPKDGEHIKVTGRMWSWTFEYPDGRTTNKLYVPKGKNIILDMTAPKNDVLHSFWIPAFRTKEDVVPGRTTQLWFNATKLGSYDIECAEYCGARHSYMLSKTIVIEPEEYKSWLASSAKYPGAPETSSEAKGKTLMSDNGCLGCHSLSGETLAGPALNDIAGKEVTVETDGEKRTIARDDAYLSDAIMKPNKDIVDGFSANVMPSSEGTMSNDDIEEIINFLQGRAKAVAAPIDPEATANELGCIGCHTTDGSKSVGPTFKGMFGSTTTVETVGGEEKELTIDEAYIKESIIDPDANVAEGFNKGIMPNLKDTISDAEIEAITSYIRGIK
jgi:cytochrome c oxidase subunit 2